MIFKHLFRPKYQDPNPKIRIQAIADLDPQESEHKSQLHELAFNDSDANVALAALERLNSFALWSKMSDTASDERIRKKATSVVEGTILGTSHIIISEQDKLTYLKECTNNALLEKVLRHYLERDDFDIVLTILKKLNKPHLNKTVLLASKDESLQLALLENIHDQQTMQKVLKKTEHDTVRVLINSRLDDIASAQIRPAEVKKQVSLILSQLLALKDEQELPRLQQKRADLETAFDQLKAEFSWLSDEERTDTTNKFVEISNRLDSWTAHLTPVWNKQHADEIIQQQFNDLRKQSDNVLHHVANALSTDASNITLGEVEQFENDLHAIELNLRALKETQTQSGRMALSPRSVETMFNDINGCRTTLESLPEFQKAISEAKLFLEGFAASPLPVEVTQTEVVQTFLDEQKQTWNTIVGVHRASWPATLTEQFSNLYSSQKKALEKLKQAAKDQADKCASKIRAVEAMIRQGRYKTAFAIFTKTQSLFDALPEASQRQLSRRFEKVETEITNLKDWQDYIARPRKPSLLDEAEKLAASPENPDEQARQIKHLRQQWNSLGKSDNDADHALNQAFDEALEQAFEVCKAHYAEQQALRLANLAKKKSLIEQFRALSSELNAAQLAVSFRQLQKQWREVGDVDYKAKDEINRQYQDITTPLRERIDTFYRDNTEQKQRLIAQAQALFEEADLDHAIEQAKSLQQQWKVVPPARRKLDNALWQQFREANDAVFARRKALQQEQLQHQNELTDTLEQLLSESEGAIERADDVTSLTKAMPDEREVLKQIDALPKKVSEKYLSRWHRLLSREQAKRAQWQQQKDAEQLNGVINCLELYKAKELPEQVDTLPGDYAIAFKNPGKPVYSRHQLLLMMEILSNKSSPEQDAEARKQVQLELMANKLGKGETASMQSLLKGFIAHGPVNDDDGKLILRVRKALGL